MSAKSTLLISSLVLVATLTACTSTEKRRAEQREKDQQAIAAQQAADAKAQREAEIKLFTQLRPDELRGLVQESVVYGYPLVAMDLTKQASTQPTSPNPENPQINEFSHMRRLSDASTQQGSYPDPHTLSSFAWVDLSKEPVVLSLPATGNHYYMMSLQDAWANVFASPGTRSTGNGAGDYAIVGPRWEGQLPANVRKIQAPTNMVRIFGRTYIKSGKDYDLVHAIQNRFQLTPLSQFDRSVRRAEVTQSSPKALGQDYIQWNVSPNEVIAEMDARNYFTRLSQLMVENPPLAEDQGMVNRLARIGVSPGKTVDFAALPMDVRRSLDEAVRSGYNRIQEISRNRAGRTVQGWWYDADSETYGNKYDDRAAVARLGIAPHLKEDVVSPRAHVDASGLPLSGTHRYVLHFARGQMPPVNGSWSLAMYSARGSVVANKLNRYSLGSNDRFRRNRDGSVSLYIQAAHPGKARAANWLPAPPGDFNLVMNMYWPKQAVLNGEWQVPGVQRVRPMQRLTQRTAKRISQR